MNEYEFYRLVRDMRLLQKKQQRLLLLKKEEHEKLKKLEEQIDETIEYYFND